MPADSGSGPVANDPDRSRGPGGGDDSDDDRITESSQVAKGADKNNNELFARIEGISLACEKLASVNTGLGGLFRDQFGLEALRGGRWGNAVYQRFFFQVQYAVVCESLVSMTHLPHGTGFCRRICAPNGNEACPGGSEGLYRKSDTTSCISPD
jgi:hypothetical protein